jgi:hypothetical protein
VGRHPSSAIAIEYEPGDEEAGREGALEHLARHDVTQRKSNRYLIMTLYG